MQIPHNLNAWSHIFNYQCFRFREFYSKMLGIEQLVSLEPEISMMVKEIKRLRPDALFFHSDLKRNLDQILNEIEYQPMLYFVCRGEGDDVTLSNVPGARRYIFNYTDIGRAAAELLLKADYKYAKRELVYVKGRLV